MKNIVLIGMMGCGKTTVGELLATRLKRTLVDTDALIERQTGMTIPEIFNREGEEYFRSLEMDLIIACGGGLPTREGAIAALAETGTVVWLDRDAGDIFDSGDMTNRPLAQNGREAFLERAAGRRPVYEKWADVTVTDFTSPVSTAARVLEAAEA